jgi:hypothetical protein
VPRVALEVELIRMLERSVGHKCRERIADGTLWTFAVSAKSGESASPAVSTTVDLAVVHSMTGVVPLSHFATCFASIVRVVESYQRDSIAETYRLEMVQAGMNMIALQRSMAVEEVQSKVKVGQSRGPRGLREANVE